MIAFSTTHPSAAQSLVPHSQGLRYWRAVQQRYDTPPRLKSSISTPCEVRNSSVCTLHLACVWLLSNADEHMEGYRIAGPYAATRHGSAPPQPGGGSGAATSSSATSDPSAVASGRWDVVEPGSLILLVDLARRGDAFTRSSMTSTFNGTSNSQGVQESCSSPLNQWMV